MRKRDSPTCRCCCKRDDDDECCCKRKCKCCGCGTLTGMNIVRFLCLVFLNVFRIAMLTILAYWGMINFSAYTYLSYLFVTFIYMLLLCAQFSVHAFRYVMLYATPYLVQNAVIVAVFIIFIIMGNPSIYTDKLTDYGGTQSLGLVYAGDFILHHLPPIEAIFLVAVLFSNHAAILRHYFDHCLTSTVARVFYVLYFLLIDTIFMLLYSIFFDFRTFYGISYSMPLIFGVTLFACLLIGGILFAVLYYSAPNIVVVPAAEKRREQPVPQTVKLSTTLISHRFEM